MTHYWFIKRISPVLRPWCWATLIIVTLQISLGIWSNIHFTPCVNFPFCKGESLLAFQFNPLHWNLAAIPSLYRLTTILTDINLGLFSFYLFSQPGFTRISSLLLILLLLQALLGIFMPHWLQAFWSVALLLAASNALIKAHRYTSDNHYVF